MSYRVVIPTAGIGSRLGYLTKFINKSLVSISHRPTLSHSIDQFPPDCEFVFALGHKGHLVREFLNLAYPNRKFYFAEVNPYVGSGSGLGFSMLCCEEYLREPFVFISCDTLVKESIPKPDCNWVGYSQSIDVSSYRTVSIIDNSIDGIHEKGFLTSNDHYPYIGLAGINNYNDFWSSMHEGGQIAIDQGEAFGLQSLHEKDCLKGHQFTWFDTGTPGTLEHVRNAFRQSHEPNILEKQNEAIWFVGDRVIKFSDDKSFIANRVKRSSQLAKFAPKILNSSAHMYCYNKIHGDTVSKVITLPLFEKLLDTCIDFWKLFELTNQEQLAFHRRCKDFYFDKTIRRVDLFYQNFEKIDSTLSINDEPMPLLSNLLARIDWENISQGIPGRFHGDFHFENILWNSETDSFTFLDWRQDFGGDLLVGDIYYDLAKLLHGLIISHEIIAANAYSIDWNDQAITYDLKRRQIHVECERYLSTWCINNKYDFSKVKILTALIYLNIAALHHYPYSLLLFALGKQMLNKELLIK